MCVYPENIRKSFRLKKKNKKNKKKGTRNAATST